MATTYCCLISSIVILFVHVCICSQVAAVAQAVSVRQAGGPLECKYADVPCREVVERRIHIVTGKKAASQDVDRLIDTGESEAVFKTAIQKQGRGHVSPHAAHALPVVMHANL